MNDFIATEIVKQLKAISDALDKTNEHLSEIENALN